MIERIESIFNNRLGKPLGNYKRAAVLIPLYNEEGEEYILFEKRALTLRKQPGDICFPGGKIEEGETPYACAIRETAEELNVKESDIRIIGEMDYIITHGGIIMYSFAGEIKEFPENPSKDEVHSIIKVPLSFFINNEPVKYDMEIGPHLKEDFPFHLIRGGKDYKFAKSYIPQYFYEYNGEIIWGHTARLIREFVNLIIG